MVKKKIFIFSYYSYKDPIFQSAILPYFQDFPSKEMFEFILLSFESKENKLNKAEKESIKTSLEQHNIRWHSTRWRSGRFKLFKKIIDFGIGTTYSLLLIYKYKVNFIYSEGFPGSIFGHYLSMLTQRKHIIHTFEPHAEYMVESHVWKDNDWETILLRKFMSKIAHKAHKLMTATTLYKEVITSWEVDEHKIMLVPSCVDTTIFHFDENRRISIRKRLGIDENTKVFVYLGKFGGMYTTKEYFEFAKTCITQYPDQKVRFWVFTSEAKEILHAYIEELGLDISLFFIQKLKKEEVPHYLSGADYGFVGILPIPSRRYSSPIKNGEYWACGLPIIIPKGISDDYELTQEHHLGYVLEDFQQDSYKAVLEKIMTKKYTFSKEKISVFAKNNRGLAKFKQKYYELFKDKSS